MPSVFTASITVTNRQRKEFNQAALADLANSINELGLINPITITKDLELIAGERRLRACRDILGWDQIEVTYKEDLDPATLHLIELEENIKREDLTWQERNDATVAYHELKAAAEPSWTKDKSAKSLGINPTILSQHLYVAEARKTDPAVSDIQNFSTAVNAVQRKRERKKADIKKDILSTEVSIEPAAPDSASPDSTSPSLSIVVSETSSPLPPPPGRVLNTSFFDWVSTNKEKFNLIHCDFPYGVDATKIGQSSAQHAGRYSDTKDDYFNLLDAFLANQDSFITPSAHLMFWYSMNYHTETVAAFTDAGWSVNPFPFVWLRSDNRGIIPDANRGPRRVYETALFAARGDRKIVKPVANAVASPTTKTTHSAEKPISVLRHFFNMLVDDSTRFLDPTCGGGNALRVAEALCARSVLGLEIDPEFAAIATSNLIAGREDPGEI